MWVILHGGGCRCLVIELPPALQFTNDMVTSAEIYVLRSDLGFLSCLARSVMSVAANDTIVRNDSNGGVGANIACSPGCLP